MRNFAIIWKEYKLGNHIDDIELSVLLRLIESLLSDLSQLNDERYRLFGDDLRSEQCRLCSYEKMRKEK